ncbi:MAG: hypothetical protein IPM01_29500 [Burkholderiaceae bacterium]|nr:hypothetical protein [Burkholderiaceae bacterium]
MLGNVRQRIREEHQVTLDIAPAVLDTLRSHCTADLSNGGRGIGAKLEAAFVNPLARLMFANMPPPESTLTLTNLDEANGVFTLRSGA